jgi:hypothetical protein
MDLTIFERATRQKMRFDTTVGLLSVEDLWSLPLSCDTGKANLDDVARALHRHLKSTADEVSFVKPAENGSDVAMELAFSVVKRVIEVRVAERDDAKAAADRKQRKQRLLEAIAKKEDEKLTSASAEELKQMLEALG